MKTQKLKSVLTGLIATAMMLCLTITTQANAIHVTQADTSKMARGKMSKDKMSKDKMGMDKMSKDKMSKDKMSKGKMSKDKMSKKDTASKM